MGCDIHCFVETRHKGDERWWPHTVDSWHYDVDVEIPINVIRWRDYLLFAKLAGVRNSYDIAPISEPRGLPVDVSKEIKREADGWGLDGHSHSYLTLEELESVDWSEIRTSTRSLGYFWEEVLPYLRYLKSDIDELRIVFWFDN